MKTIEHIIKNIPSNLINEEIYIDEETDIINIYIDDNIKDTNLKGLINIIYIDNYNVDLQINLKSNKIYECDIVFTGDDINEIIYIESLNIVESFPNQNKINKITFINNVHNIDYFFYCNFAALVLELRNQSITIPNKFDYLIKTYFTNNQNININIEFLNEKAISTIKTESESLILIKNNKPEIIRKFNNSYLQSLALKTIFPVIFSNANVVDFKFQIIEYDLFYKDIKIPYYLFENSNLKIQEVTGHDLNFLLLLDTKIETSKKLNNFNANFFDENSIDKIINIELFGNLKNRKKLKLIPFVNSSFHERWNLFNILVSWILKFQLKLEVALMLLFFFILSGSIIFNQKDMAPLDSITAQNYLQNTMKSNHKILNIESKENWSYTDGYQQFNALLYSIDIAIPIFDLGQSKSWTPLFDDKRLWIIMYYYFLKIVSKLLLFFCLIQIIDVWKRNGEENE